MNRLSIRPLAPDRHRLSWYARPAMSWWGVLHAVCDGYPVDPTRSVARRVHRRDGRVRHGDLPAHPVSLVGRLQRTTRFLSWPGGSGGSSETFRLRGATAAGSVAGRYSLAGQVPSGRRPA